MSRSPTLAALRRAASVVACGLGLAPMAACHQQSGMAGRPSSPKNVSVGYGQQSPEQTGGAVQSLTADELKSRQAKRVEELLLGRFPGVHVLPTATGGFSIRIRSAASLDGREPLYVVDGMPVDVTPGRGIDWLDPADIERIDVLKDPAHTSIFGGRGANGVVLITTKRARR